MPNPSGPLYTQRYPALDSVLNGVKHLSQSQRARSVIWSMAAVFFLGGMALALTQIDFSEIELTVGPLVALLCLVIPANLALNTLETEYSARLFGRSFGIWRAFRLTVLGTAANMLPLPGAAAVRVAGLASLKIPALSGGAVTLSIALIWLGLSLALAGAFTLVLHLPIAMAVLVLGFIFTGFGVAGLINRSTARGPILAILVIKAGVTVLSVLRIMLAFLALGLMMPFEVAAIFAVSGVLGSAASIIPAGLGLREGVSAGLAPLVGVSAPLAFIATALDRLVSMALLFALTLCLVGPADRLLLKEDQPVG